jgi:hypothetical protein
VAGVGWSAPFGRPGWSAPAGGHGVQARRTTRRGAGLATLAGPVGAVAALYGLLIAARLALHGGDPSAFVAAGDMFAQAAQVPPGLHVLTHSSGYDGQTYYRLALEPWTAQAAAHGIRLDNPAYRQQRILYPLLAWLLSLGRPAALPVALVAVNLLGLCLTAAGGVALAQAYQRPVWWGVLPALYPGFAVTLALDLGEIVEAALLLGGLALLCHKRHVGAALCFTLAVLTRETALLVPVALATVWARDRLLHPGMRPVGASDRARTRLWLRSHPHVSSARPAYLFALPIAVYGAWQGLLWCRWHTLPFRGNGGNLGVPLVGLAGVAGRLAPWARPPDALWLLELLALAGFGVGVLVALRAGRAPEGLQPAWLLYGVLSACLGASVWGEDLGFLRALSEWYVLGTVLLIASPRAERTGLVFAPMLALWGWMWLAMALL